MIACLALAQATPSPDVGMGTGLLLVMPLVLLAGLALLILLGRAIVTWYLKLTPMLEELRRIRAALEAIHGQAARNQTAAERPVGSPH